MAALSGKIEEWHEVKPGLWIRVVGEDWIEDDGIIQLAPHMSFADYWTKRATEKPEPERDLAAEFDALKATVEGQATKLRSLETRK